MTETLDITTAASLLGVTTRRARQMCESGKLVGAVNRGRGWEIPRTAHAMFYDAARTGGSADALSGIAKHKRQAALSRLGLVAAAERFIAAAIRSGGSRRQAMAAFCRDADVSVRSMQRWMSDYRKDGIAGLIDGRGAGSTGPEISADAWNEFLSLYLDLRRPSVRQVYDIVCFKNQQQGLQWRIPSLRRVQQMVCERVPKPVLILHREGQAAYDEQCAPYIETDLDAVEPGAVWIGDHHQCDCWVQYRGKWIRPWLTAWEDMRSRTIVGWKLTDSPNATTILLAFRHGCERFGPPEAVKIDNGKDYDSELFTGTTKQRRRLQVKLDTENVSGLYALMNISVSFSIPYHPQSKAIERWFDTLEGQFVRTMPTYCGKDTQRRPEDLFDYLKTSRALDEAMELDEFGELIGQYIEVYNNTAHSGRGMNQATPMSVMASRSGRRMVDADSLGLLCQVWTKAKVGKNGVTVRGITGYGQYDPLLHQYFGRDVRCTYDPDDMETVRVFDANTYQYITTAAQQPFAGYQVGEDDIRKQTAAKARARKVVKQFKPAAKIANTSLTHLAVAAALSRTQPPSDETTMPALRPVATVMDGQATVIGRVERTRRLKRAVGAEGTTRDIELNLDMMRSSPADAEIDLRLGVIEPPKKNINLRLFER
ncbi:MAG: transposase domain-containing protein [Patescibacteria group bacterium]